jgi:hypothetical protein
LNGIAMKSPRQLFDCAALNARIARATRTDKRETGKTLPNSRNEDNPDLRGQSHDPHPAKRPGPQPAGQVMPPSHKIGQKRQRGALPARPFAQFLALALRYPPKD